MEIYKNTTDLFLDGEIWKDINDFPDYRISNFGRIKSFKQNKIDGKILVQIKDRYLNIKLSRNGKCEFKKIHRLLFETFNNRKLKDNECVHHLNENKLDNDLNNIQLMINYNHKSLHNSGKNHPMYGKKCPKHSKRMSGENNPNSILKEISKLFGVHESTISAIKNKKNWSD